MNRSSQSRSDLLKADQQILAVADTLIVDQILADTLITDQILAVADTLIAGEKRINNQPDWYAVLQLVSHIHDSELIASQYRRLALLLNPQQNNLPFADRCINRAGELESLYMDEIELRIEPVSLFRLSKSSAQHMRFSEIDRNRTGDFVVSEI